MNAKQLMESLKKHEGLRTVAYQDTEGIWTIGYGRNLQELKITEKEAAIWLAQDAGKAHMEARGFVEYKYLNTDARRNAFIEMVFNMGAPRVRQFKKMLAALRARDFGTAAVEMLDSKWAKQVGRRATVLASMMRTGEFLD